MTFLNPAAFAALGALSAVLIALYMIRMRRRDMVVPASFLWPERTDEIRANSLFQKLKFSWLLVLQLLALLLIGLAWARPQMKQEGLAGSVTVVVLDGSASMRAKEGGDTRFGQGLGQVRNMISQARVGDRLALILAGTEPKVIFPLSSDPARQRLSLVGVAPTDADADVGEAMRLAAALAGTTTGAKIVLLSDGVFSEIENFNAGKAEVLFRKLGAATENLAVQAFGFGSGLVYGSVKNYGLKEAKATVTFKADGEPINSENITIAPEKAWSKTIEPPAGKKVFEIEIKADDALASDNFGYALADPSASLRVLLVTRGNLFLERALALEPRVTLDKAAAVPPNEQKSSSGQGVYDIVIFDGVPEEPVKARGVLTLGSQSSASPVTDQGEGKNFQYLNSTDHPVVAGVDFGEAYIEKFRRISPRGTARSVAEGKSGPLVVVKDGGQRQIYLAFEPLESDFPLTVSFPIFLANSLDWLGGEATGQDALIKPGQAFALAAERAAARRQGFEREFQGRAGRVIVRGLDQIGKYDVTWPGGKRSVYVQMRSEDESRIRPQENIRMGGNSVAGQSATSRMSDFWKPLMILALLVLAGEWLLFARRS